MMFVVGLTGGIASGKSTVARMFEEQGVPVICADALAHQVVEPGSPALGEIESVFGTAVFDSDGRLDRAAVASRVFDDSNLRRKLEAIIHPRVAEEQARRIRELERQGHALVIVDVPLLYEAGLEKTVDCVVVVYVPAEVQESRAMARDGTDRASVQGRLRAQLVLDEKRRRADFVIDNSETEDRTRGQVLETLAAIRTRMTTGEMEPVPGPR